MVTVKGHSPGSRKQLFNTFSVSVPIVQGKSDGITLRDLITWMVNEQVQAFNDRQHNNQFIRVLTERKIEEGVLAGKISSGGSEVPLTSTDIEQSVEVALDAFEDGLYLVAIDSLQYQKLDQIVKLSADSRVTFIRLALLASG